MAQKDKAAQLLDLLKQERTAYVAWVQRKEIAVWSAIIFYAAVLWTIFNTFVKESKNISMLSDSITIFILFVLAKIFFHFIHSQFASIYYTGCRNEALFTITQKILEKSDYVDKLDYSNSDDGIYPMYIDKKMKEIFPRIQPFRGHKHPLKILFVFWFGWFYKRATRKLMSNHHKQEACIYSLIIMMNVIFILFLINRLGILTWSSSF